jgi:hypothetical protein
MKLSTFVLGVSVVANLALLSVIAIGPGKLSAPPTEKPANVAPVAKAPALPASDTWEKLQAADLKSQRDRLQAEGFPPALVRAILSAQIAEKYRAQAQALRAGTDDLPYWKNPTPDAQLAAAQRALWRAEQKEVRDLLGPDPENPAGASFLRQIPGLSSDKAAELAAIEERYGDQRSQLYSNGPMMPADRAKMDALEKAMHAEFAALLTPDQMEAYDLRASRTAQQLQYTLMAFDPTEAEYRAIYRIQSAFHDQNSEATMAAPEQMQARQAAMAQLNKEIAEALGPDRYAQYERATDYNYRMTTQLAQRLQLPAGTADTLYAVQKEYQQKQKDVFAAARGEGNFNTAQEQLVALQQEATARISGLLNGDARAIDAYKQYGGQWLRNLAPTIRRGPASGSSTTVETIRSVP